MCLPSVTENWKKTNYRRQFSNVHLYLDERINCLGTDTLFWFLMKIHDKSWKRNEQRKKIVRSETHKIIAHCQHFFRLCEEACCELTNWDTQKKRQLYVFPWMRKFKYLCTPWQIDGISPPGLRTFLLFLTFIFETHDSSCVFFSFFVERSECVEREGVYLPNVGCKTYEPK